MRGQKQMRAAMASPLVKLDMRQIHDWTSFHDLFSKALGFPDFYGRNINA
jgi:RNAse (barnase) inhibitor barstar